MSKCQTDGFSEADGILGTGQRGRGGETEVQSMGIQAGAGWGGMEVGGAAGRGESAWLRAERNALKRREERAREGGLQGTGTSAGSRQPIGGSGHRRGGSAAAQASLGPGAPTFPQSANFAGECRARTFWARGNGGENLRFLGKIIGLLSSPFPCYKSPLKRQTRITANLPSSCPSSTPGTMKAAVDLKPTLTIIKTEKVDLELFPSPGEW